MNEFVRLVGCFTGLVIFVKLFNICKSIFIMNWSQPIDFKCCGKWAVVTGSTDGIGKAYAEELAKHGMDVVLISRSSLKLKEVAESIENTFGVACKTVCVDFTHDDIWYDLYETLQNLDIGVLVNNVGMGVQQPQIFTQVCGGASFSEAAIKCNMSAMTLMSQIVLPKMLHKRRGIIVNVGSFCGVAPGPLVAVYAATKAYVDSFSRAVSSEYSDSGVIIQTLMPGLVATKLIHYVSKIPLIIVKPKVFVTSALRTIGRLDYTTGYWVHEIQTCLLFLLRSISSEAAVFFNEKSVAWSNKPHHK